MEINRIDDLSTENERNEKDAHLKAKGAYGLSAGAAFVASLCCLVPLIAIMIGLGSFSFLLSFTKYRPYFLALSLFLFAIILWWHWHSNKKCCRTKQDKSRFMNITIVITVIYVLLLGLLNFALPAAIISYQAKSSSGQSLLSKSEVKMNLKIGGLSCPTCPETIRRVLTKEKGVSDVSIKYPSGKGYMIFEPSKIKKEKIVKILEKAGYTIESMTLNKARN